MALDEGDPLDVVIMDLTIPGGMGGKEAIVKLKEIDPGGQGNRVKRVFKRSHHGKLP